ncbi:serine hydrolase domain-containing protein [Aliiglaciecola sp. NS0011-25]|uniref:serine hydrolase domain-containing protein n=1 Tax=Aliiglaciecola sp. NS0011-25 TaxID=3127654 RepID=UPI003106BD6E
MRNVYFYPVIFFFAFSLSACVADTQSVKTSEFSESVDQALGADDWLGATYDAPESWVEDKGPELIKYTAPEDDSFMVITVVKGADDAAKAAMLAWQKFSPGFAREVRFINDEVANNGWQQQTFIEYESAISEERGFYAVVLRNADDWHVVLVDSSFAVLGKRGSQLNTLLQSYTVLGYDGENFASASAHKLDSQKVEALLSFVNESAKKLKIPGAGIAVVQDGNVVYEGGVGVKNIASGEPVDKDTLFMVASNTKGMTTLLLAKLVEMGKLDWDDKVTDHYPEFKLGSQETTDKVLIRHLVCACTGLPRKDMTWVFNSGPDAPALMAVEDLANVEPTSDFGELYQYNNQMPAVAGLIAGHILYPDMEIGAAYDKAMQEFIFDPLQMNNTTFSFETALAGNVATPYAINFESEIEEVEQTSDQGFNLTILPYRPSGGAFSSVSDMLKYLANELTLGVSPQGKRLFAQTPLLERRIPGVSSGKDEYYGMGLSTKKIAGVEIIEHGGSMAGFKSQFIVIPSANVAAVILTNSDEGYYLTSAFQRKLIELLYDAEPKAADEVDVFALEQQKINASRLDEMDLPGDAAILANLATHYENDILGEVSISTVAGETIFDPGVWKSPLTTKTSSDGSNSIVMLNPIMFGMELVIGQNESGKRTLKLIDTQHSYVFTEVSAK